MVNSYGQQFNQSQQYKYIINILCKVGGSVYHTFFSLFDVSSFVVVNGLFDSRYNCCGGDSSSEGCQVAKVHVL